MRRILARIAHLLSLMLLAVPIFAAAQSYPAKPIVWIVPFPAGGLADFLARQIAPRVSKELGQTVLIENVGGAGGALAAARTLAAAADGYTVMQASPSEVILTPLGNAAIKYQPRDFTLISPFANHPLSLIVKKELPPNTTEEFVAYARAHPGAVSYGTMGVGSLYHLAMEDFAGRFGLKMLHVPYKGGAPLLQDMGGGVVDSALLPFTTTYVDYATAGKLKLLSIAAPSRLSVIKNTPTINESGLVKDFNIGVWSGLFVKAGTPAAITAKLHSALETAMKDPGIRNALESNGTEVTNTMPMTETAAFLNSEATRYRNLTSRLGLTNQ